MCIGGMRVLQTDRRKGIGRGINYVKKTRYTETEKKTSIESQIMEPHKCQECKYYILLSIYRCALYTDISIERRLSQ